ncbi:hypothetical protein Btru_076233 [Bulinus truncatus]|nr:hypothetical protein Btru_076233 [Bulinus truncatus]
MSDPYIVMSSSESQQNGFGDSVRIESAVGILQVAPLSDVSGDEEHPKDHPINTIISTSQESEKVSDMANLVPEESSGRPSVEDNVQQDELLFPVTPPVSDETDLDFAEQKMDGFLFVLGFTKHELKKISIYKLYNQFSNT